MKPNIVRLIAVAAGLFVVPLIAGASSAGPVPLATAVTFTVNTTADTTTCSTNCSLRGAIIAANAASGDNLIILPSGIYSLTLNGRNEDASATGDLDITSNLTISGTNAATTIIDGKQIDRVFHIITGTVNVTLVNVTIRSGYAPGLAGGIWVGASTRLTLVNCIVTSNSGQNGDYGSGGGIYNDGTLTLVNTTVISNSVYSSGYTGGAALGGGIYNNGNLALIDSLVGNNAAGFGGGIYNKGTLDLTHSTVNGNSAMSSAFFLTGYGGGIANDGGTTALHNSSVISNTTLGSGGGICNKAGALSLSYTTVSTNTAGSFGGSGGGIESSGGTLTLYNSIVSGNSLTGTYGGGGISTSGVANLINSTISRNRAPSAAGISTGGNTNLTNCTISDNVADNYAGGISAAGKTNLTNCTVSGNVAAGTSGYGTGGVYGGIGLTLTNTIIAGNSDTVGDPDCTLYQPISLGHNLIGNGNGCNLAPAPGDQVGTPASPIDPKLGPLQNNGGPTFTRALLAGSPAIDAGDPARCPGFDQRGCMRQNNCDIGAYEFGGIPFVPTSFIYLPVVIR